MEPNSLYEGAYQIEIAEGVFYHLYILPDGEYDILDSDHNPVDDIVLREYDDIIKQALNEYYH